MFAPPAKLWILDWTLVGLRCRPLEMPPPRNTRLSRQARLAYARRQAHLSMLTLFTALLGAKTSLLEMGVQANQRYWQHLTSSNLEQLLQVCAACL